MAPSRKFQEMNVDRCWSLLKRKNVGRLAVSIKNKPDVFPVSYAVDNETLVIRTNPGLKLAASTLGSGVAFEVDDLDELRHVGSSVVVQGRAVEIESLEELMEAEQLLIEPWQDSGKSRYLRIYPDDIVGREVVAVEPDHHPAGGRGQ